MSKGRKAEAKFLKIVETTVGLTSAWRDLEPEFLPRDLLHRFHVESWQKIETSHSLAPFDTIDYEQVFNPAREIDMCWASSWRRS